MGFVATTILKIWMLVWSLFSLSITHFFCLNIAFERGQGGSLMRLGAFLRFPSQYDYQKNVPANLNSDEHKVALIKIRSKFKELHLSK